MKDLLNFVKLLKVAVSNDNYPLYSSYLFSDGKTVRTCNNTAYVSLNYKAPFKGCVNFYVLEDILNNIGEDAEYYQKDNQLKIVSGSYENFLNIMDFDFPDLNLPEGVELIDLTEEDLNMWRFATKYCGKESLSPLYVDGEGTLATDGSRIFLNHKKWSIGNKLALTPKILSFVRPEFKLGADDRGNINIVFNGGYAKFIADKLDFYLDDRIRKFVNESSKDVKLLCNVAVLRDCAEKLAPIFHGEIESVANISNKDNKLEIIATSSVNGRSNVIINSELKEEFAINMNLRFFGNIPFNFDVYVNPSKDDRLFLQDENGSRVVLMGVK
jgi:hypothetical protein